MGNWKEKLIVLSLWQLCSGILTASGTMCTLTVMKFGKTIPFLQQSFSYLILFLANVWRWPKSQSKWWPYILIGILEVAGDYCAINGYNYTSLSSAITLNTTVVFWVIPISYLILKSKTNWIQLVSIVLAFAGVSMILISDGFGDSKWLGNVLSLCNSVIYAFLTVIQEKLVSDDSPILYMCRYSICSFFISIILCGCIEHELIHLYPWNYENILYMSGYAIFLFLYNIIAPFVMRKSSAIELNLSLLTSNFYSLIISIIFFKQKATILYLVGFLLVPIGISLYCYGESKLLKVREYENLSNDHLSNHYVN